MKALRNPKSLCVCDTFECRNDAAVTALSSSSCHGPSSVSATPDSICAALYHSNCCHFMTCLNEALSITVVRCDSLINGVSFYQKMHIIWKLEGEVKEGGGGEVFRKLLTAGMGCTQLEESGGILKY